MKPKMRENLEIAAKEVWNETPDLRAQYGHNFQAYWDHTYLTWEWRTNPQIREEFQQNFEGFMAYKRHEAVGDISPA